MKAWMVILGVGLSVMHGVDAANVAYDDAANAAYSDGWQTGDNGGFGFGAWTLSTVSGDSSRNGHFIGDSSLNGDPAPTGDINTSGAAWGLYANQLVGMEGPVIGVATAFRPFTGGELAINQTLRLRMDNGLVDPMQIGPGTVGFSLNRFSFFFANGATEYRIGNGNPSDAVGLTGTGVPLTYNGLDIAFTRTGTDTYELIVTPNGGSAVVINGVMPDTGGSLDGITLYNRTAGPGSSRDLFFNNLEIVPEPTTLGLALTGALLGLFAHRRRIT